MKIKPDSLSNLIHETTKIDNHKQRLDPVDENSP